MDINDNHEIFRLTSVGLSRQAVASRLGGRQVDCPEVLGDHQIRLHYSGAGQRNHHC